MEFLQHIDVLILTYNEEPNIARTLAALGQFPRIVVVDSGSTDRTCEIAASHPNVRIERHPFKSHATQWTFGLAECRLQAPWVLALDADYVLGAELVDEISSLSPPGDVGGYRARFQYMVLGRPLSASLYPPIVILYRREGASYMQDGHTHRLVPRGRLLELQHFVSHDDRKPFAAWLAAQDRYARLECDVLRAARWGDLKWSDRVRRLLVIAPWLVPLYCLFLRGGVFDGRAGLLYAAQRAIAETILSARLLEAALVADDSP
jgi:glycosyltransferase involved in cell wall biosynthesis